MQISNINVIVRDLDGNELEIKIHPDTQLRRIYRMYANAYSVDLEDKRFLFEGNLCLDANRSLQANGFDDGSVLDVMKEQMDD